MGAPGDRPALVVIRIVVGIALLSAGCTAAGMRGRATPPPADETQGVELRSRSDVAGARELDHEGVRSFREGRYADAIRYFRAAARLGGPSSELWNIARSREKLDDAEEAASTIDEYLARRDLSPQDRADAEREVRALRARPSVLTVTTNPPAAVAAVDGKTVPGTTPLSLEVGPGPHTLTLRRDGYASEKLPLEARFGRALIVSLDLVRAAK